MYEDIIDELKSHGVHSIILYGSRARGDFTPTSDIDIIGFEMKGKTSELQGRMKNINGLFVHRILQVY